MSDLIQPEEGLFLVYRSSGIEPPCKEAFEVQYLEKTTLRKSIAHCTEEQKLNETIYWKKAGENYRTEIINGEEFMVREFSQINPGWAVRLPDLAALLEFIKTYEDCILRVKETGVAEIEIYDYYRE